ncbi:MAG: helix-turn-helix domain-containing protein [Propionicimonas sp.]|nr:helix-turn-helix domain-containing protein [Propionicimonas sp.]
MPADLVAAQLLKLPEGQWYERKSGRIRARDLAVPLIAFANAEGGTVAVGLSDGEVDGVTPARTNEIRQAAQDFTNPPVRMRVSELADPLTQRTLLLLHVEPGEQVHETSRGECYLRVGDESRRLTFAQRQELGFDRGSAPFDGTPVEESPAGLDPDQVEAYQQAIRSTTPELMMRARNLLTQDGRLTVAGYLLFSAAPQELFPNAQVRVLKYTDIERGSGSSLTLADDGDIRCEGSIPEQITHAAQAIDSMIPKRRALNESGRFAGLPIIPRDAWIEGLVNAVVHRSYSMSGDHVRVEIFPNRIEITSPGRFPGLADPTNPLSISRHARNPRIARVCSDLGITQELGEGIRRIFAEMRLRGLTDPLYTQTPAAVRLTLSSADTVSAEIRAALPKGAMAVLDNLRSAGRPLGTGQIAELVGVTRPTAGRHLQALRDAGLVLWEGESPKDPRATWKVR